MIYLDQAATSWPKPPQVLQAAKAALTLPLGNPGRSAHPPAMAASRLLLEARGKVGSLFGVEEEGVIFTLNTTHALNLALFGLAAGFSPQKNTVLTDHFQHNSVLRPLYALEQQQKIRLRFCNPLRIQEALDPSVALGVFSARSNVTGQAFPLAALSQSLHQAGALLLCDGAQGAGTMPLSLEERGIDLLCIPGHKGLMGITGSGALLLSPRCPSLSPLLLGGSGSDSRNREMPSFLPDRLEAGTPALAAIAAMGAGADYVKKQGVTTIARHEKALSTLFCRCLQEDSRFFLYSPPDSGIVLLNQKNTSPHALAAALGEQGICVRAGLHCAPLAHKALGTGPEGALRLSFGWFNTAAEAQNAAKALMNLSLP